MTNSVSDKTMVVISKVGDYWVNKRRASAIMKIKEQNPNSSIELDGSLISCNVIDGIITASQYDDLNKKRRGAWCCKFGKWHERNEQCAHHLVSR